MYFFTHKKEDYLVEWEESDKILTLTFSKDGKVLSTRDIKLLGTIDQQQLNQLVKDYWNSFKRKELNKS